MEPLLRGYKRNMGFPRRITSAASSCVGQLCNANSFSFRLDLYKIFTSKGVYVVPEILMFSYHGFIGSQQRLMNGHNVQQYHCMMRFDGKMKGIENNDCDITSGKLRLGIKHSF